MKCIIYFCPDLRKPDGLSLPIAEIYKNGQIKILKEFKGLELMTKEFINVYLEQISKAENPIEFALKNSGQPYTSIFTKLES